MKTQISMVVKLTVWREKCLWGKEVGVQKNRKEALVLIPHQITAKHTECVHTRISFVLSLIVNTATGSQSHGQALVLNAVIPTCFCAVNVPKVLKVKDSP